VALAAASVGALAAALLRQSPVLGFVAAGMVIGPHTPGFVADIDVVEDLADVGIVLLMFAVGVQLSFADLTNVGRTALAGALFQVAASVAVGYAAGLLFGWGWLEALFLGAVVSNSSSTVIARLLDERGEARSLHGQLGLAWSSIQDFGTVVLIVVLTALSEREDQSLTFEVLAATGLAVLFLAIVVPLGLLMLPWVFDRVSEFESSELFVLAVAGVALGVAYLASVFGISVALGAFLAGLLVGRSDRSHEIFTEIRPVRDVFAGIFFVSVGMLIDPEVMLDRPVLLLATVGLITAFKGGLSAAIGLAAGYRARTALLAGALLAQSAEFSFLMARIGADVGAVSSEAFSVMMAGAVISVVLLPATVAAVRPLIRPIEQRLPPDLAHLPEEERARPPVGHVIVCGYGSTGRLVVEQIRHAGMPFVIIDRDGPTIAGARRERLLAIQGEAQSPQALREAGVEVARGLVVALRDPAAERAIVEAARELNPQLAVAVGPDDAQRLLRRLAI
jgi:CPA2 family monovalent cation:H+ antiporter-2